jgi:sugar fermentation stimulation protein A
LAERPHPTRTPITSDRVGFLYRYPHPVLPVTVVDRPNRFLVRVCMTDGRTEEAHLPNPGRLRELVRPGVRGHVARASRIDRERRKTRLTLINVERPPPSDGWVSVDTMLARPVVDRALREGRIAPLRPWGPWRSEVRWKGCRFDHGVFGEGTGARPCALLEVKSSNLRDGVTALFPDAPTTRGTHHAEVLADFARQGGRAAFLFLIQRSDTEVFRPYGAMDPKFARALEEARRAGVILLAWSLRILPDGVRWGRRLPVRPARWTPGSDLGSGLKGRTAVHDSPGEP